MTLDEATKKWEEKQDDLDVVRTIYYSENNLKEATYVTMQLNLVGEFLEDLEKIKCKERNCA